MCACNPRSPLTLACGLLVCQNDGTEVDTASDEPTDLVIPGACLRLSPSSNNGEWALIPKGCRAGGNLPPDCKTSSAPVPTVDGSGGSLIHRQTYPGKGSYCAIHPPPIRARWTLLGIPEPPLGSSLSWRLSLEDVKSPWAQSLRCI